MTALVTFLPPATPCGLPLQRCSVGRDQASQRVLVIGLGALGDVIAQTPLLAALRGAYPDVFLTWVVKAQYQDAIGANPFVDEIGVWNDDRWKFLLPTACLKYLDPRRLLGLRGLAASVKLVQALRRRRFDQLVCFQPQECRFLVRGAGAKVSIGVLPLGMGKASRRSAPFTDLCVAADSAKSASAHMTERALKPLPILGLPPPKVPQASFGYTSEDDATVVAFLTASGASSQERFVVLAPATSWATKNWPASRYAALGDVLVREYGCHVVVTGADAESGIVRRVAAEMREPSTLAIGAFTFRQLGALLARSALVVSGDTAPMHLAAALGVPYVALFGPTDPERYAPSKGHGVVLRHRVSCGPCHKKICGQEDTLRCLRLIEVDEVQAAARRLLGVSDGCAGIPPLALEMESI